MILVRPHDALSPSSSRAWVLRVPVHIEIPIGGNEDSRHSSGPNRGAVVFDDGPGATVQWRRRWQVVVRMRGDRAGVARPKTPSDGRLGL